MTPEERAKALVPEVFGEDYHVPAFRALIAQAIRNAENEALERAERAAKSSFLGMPCFVDATDCGQFNSGIRHAAKAVAALKSKEI